MTVLFKKSKSLVYLLWAVSVFLLCTGSLINFHQNKIWGKPLNFELVAVKREAKSLKIATDDNRSHGDFTLGSMLSPDQYIHFDNPVTGFPEFAEIRPALLSSDPPANILRGPPSV